MKPPKSSCPSLATAFHPPTPRVTLAADSAFPPFKPCPSCLHVCLLRERILLAFTKDFSQPPMERAFFLSYWTFQWYVTLLVPFPCDSSSLPLPSTSNSFKCLLSSPTFYRLSPRCIFFSSL